MIDKSKADALVSAGKKYVPRGNVLHLDLERDCPPGCVPYVLIFMGWAPEEYGQDDRPGKAGGLVQDHGVPSSYRVFSPSIKRRGVMELTRSLRSDVTTDGLRRLSPSWADGLHSRGTPCHSTDVSPSEQSYAPSIPVASYS